MMGTNTNLSQRMVVVAVFVALTFAVPGLVAVTLLAGSSVVAQNETAGNETGTANETALYSNQTGMAPVTKR
jgi:hypothetical protein